MADEAPKSTAQMLASPLTLAIVGGFITIMTSVITTHLTAVEANATARKTLEAELIKNAITDQNLRNARENLGFLVAANLIPDYAEDVREYIGNGSPIPLLTTTGPKICLGVPDGKACGKACKCAGGLPHFE